MTRKSIWAVRKHITKTFSNFIGTVMKYVCRDHIDKIYNHFENIIYVEATR